MQSISSGGVGEAYPGSTGGEIFNSYEGGNRNQASGSYSTAIGFKNRSLAADSFTFGSNNTNSGSCAIVGGSNNTMTAAGNYGCIFGINNSPSYGGYIIGSYNTASGIVIGNNNSNYYSYLVNGILIGDHLNYNAQASFNPIIIGHYNNYPALSSASLIFACGTSNALKNAIEISTDYTKICNRFQLGNNAWAVSITDPPDPNNPTFDDRILATKSYVTSQVPSLAALQGITFKRTYTAVTGQITALTPGTDYNIETLFSITIPSWATHMKIGYDISSKQGYVYMNLGVVGNYPILIPDHDTSEMYSFILGWQPSTKELQLSYGYKWSAGFPAIDQNLGFSIMSIRFEGDYTPFPVTP